MLWEMSFSEGILRMSRTYLISLIHVSDVLTTLVNNNKCCFLSTFLDKSWHLF
jgi:hypothetical protein